MAKNPSRKWAVHAEWCFERQGLPVSVLGRRLKTHARTIAAWDRGTRPVPHWAPQVLRLQRFEAAVGLAQMTGRHAARPVLGLTQFDLISFQTPSSLTA